MAKYKDIMPVQYLITNEHDREWGITINSVGFQSVKSGEPYPPVNHPKRYLFSPVTGRILDEYQLVYLVRGQGKFSSASQKPAEITPGNMFMLFPHEWHSYYPDTETGWDEYWIGFQGVNIDSRITSSFFSKQQPIFRVGLQSEIVELFNLAIEIAQEQKAGFQQMLAGIANMLLGYTYFYNKNFSFEEIAVTKQINEAKILMRNSFRTGINAQEIAEQVQMGYSWFRHIFKKYTGFAPNQYILELKIQHSKSLLTNTAFSVKEIAYESGFDNHEYFCTIFRRKVDMTPVQYRKFTQGPVKKDTLPANPRAKPAGTKSRNSPGVRKK